MPALVMRLAALGIALPIGLSALLFFFRPGGELRGVIGLLLLVSTPPWAVLGTLLPALLKMQTLFMAVVIPLNGLLYAGMGAWLSSSQGRPAVIRYGPIVATWIVLIGIARKFTD